ncbi:hypothetical protein ACJZ2D_002836 [Fusarium nematophilum]
MAILLLVLAASAAAVDLGECQKRVRKGLDDQTILPNDSIFYHNGSGYMSHPSKLQLTIDGCIDMCPRPKFDLYDDMWPRLLTWLLPALLLVGNLHVARVGTVDRMLAAMHFMGDPIDSAWSLLTKAEVWNRYYAIALRNTPRGTEREARARALAALLSAFEELTSDMSQVHKELEVIVNENAARLSKQDLDHIMLEAAEELVDSRSNEVLRTSLVILNYLWSVLSALIPQIGGPQSSTPGGRIGTAMFLSWLVTVVMLSNTLSGFVSRRTCLRIMERYCRTVKGRKRDQHVFPNSPLLGSKSDFFLKHSNSNVIDYIDSQPWTGSIYNFRPNKALIRGDENDRSPWHLLMLSVAPVLIAAVCAAVILWYTPTPGLDCRSLWVISSAFALLMSPVLSWLIQRFNAGQLAWSSVFSRGRNAYVGLDPKPDREYNLHHIYPAMVATCLGLQLVTYGLMFRIMRPGAKVFRPDEDTKMEIYRRVHGFDTPEIEMEGKGASRNWRSTSDAGELLLPPPAMSPQTSPQLVPSGDVFGREYFIHGDREARRESDGSFGGFTAARRFSTTRVAFSSKVFEDADAAVADVKSGSTVLSSGFGLCGVADTLIAALNRRGRDSLHSLTAVSNNAGQEGKGGLAVLTSSGQVDRLILSYLGNNKVLEKKYLTGELAIELCPQGTLAERIRAAGAGIPAFFTPTAAHTLVQEGEIPVRLNKSGAVVERGRKRETREFNGRTFLMETALQGDVAILRASKADKEGNCVFRYTTKAFGPLMAKAAKLTIVEAEEIVEVGAIQPNEVDLPGIFVDRIVPSTEEKKIEVLKTREEGDAGPPKATSEAQERRSRIARRAAKELKPGYYVNLGVGIPTLAVSFLPADNKVWIQSENGILGMGPYPTKDEVDPDIVNAGKETVTLVPGASCFDSSESFAMIRGGHVDVSILGALQVSAVGDLANYMIPGKVFKGMGGAMDLVANPDNTKIVVATEHCAKDGSSKVLQQCTLPLTGARVVSTIITDLCVFEVDRAQGTLTLTELAPGVTVDEVRSKTEADFAEAAEIKPME